MYQQYECRKKYIIIAKHCKDHVKYVKSIIMKSRYRKKEASKEQSPIPFFDKAKGSASMGSAPFFTSSSMVQTKKAIKDSTKTIQMQPSEKPEKKEGSNADAGKTVFDIATIRNEYVSTIFAEAWPGQENDIAWIYYNLISDAKGISALKKSSAFKEKSDNYKIAMTALGDKRYEADKPSSGWLKKTKAKSIRDYVDNNAYFKSNAAPRILSVASIVDGILKDSSKNPYSGWTGQGNLDDFNNVSSPNSKYWKMARAYYWLQESGAVKEAHVKPVGSGKTIQFIFNGKKIEQYFKSNKLPDKVPLYELK